MIEIYREIVNLISRRERAALASIVSASGSVPREAGSKMLISENGSFIGTIGGGGAELKALYAAAEVINTGKTQMLHFDMSGKGEKAAMICGGQLDVLIEPILYRDTLYLFGAGHISQVTSRIAKMLDFDVTVIDPRPDYCNRDHFPGADALLAEEYESVFSKLVVPQSSYIVIFTTGHVFDEHCLNFALSTRASYIGMIGSRKKAADVKERLLKKGVPADKLEKVHSPVGIEIGAETPAEIAVSIIAEIVKFKRLQN